MKYEDLLKIQELTSLNNPSDRTPLQKTLLISQ